MTKRLNWGILATGKIAGLFAQDILLAGLNITAVGSRSHENAKAFAKPFKIPNIYDSYEGLVADPDVDIIYIATPHPQHANSALLALRAGKHVLVEKPFTLNAAEARLITELASENKLVILEAMWTRFLPHMKRIHEIIAAGTLGKLRSIHAEHRQFLSSDPKHRLNNIELGGGALLDLGIYPVSFAFDILGAPHSVKSFARLKETGVDAEIATLMEHSEGAISTCVSALDCAGSNGATIYGTSARIEIAPVWYKPTSFQVLDHTNNVLEEYGETVSGRGMQFQAFEMEHLVRTGTNSTIMAPEQSVAIMATLDTIREQIGLVYPTDH